MKASKGIFEFVKILSGESVTVGNVTEVEEGWEALDHLRWHMTHNSSQIDLKYEWWISEPVLRWEKGITFISAFESLPVHCSKSRPSGKRRNPGKGGTADILEAPMSRVWGKK
jgi:hypothetical protein